MKNYVEDCGLKEKSDSKRFEKQLIYKLVMK